MEELTEVEQAIYDLKYKMFNEVLKEIGVDFGKYPQEEIVKMYQRHKDEIKKD